MAKKKSQPKAAAKGESAEPTQASEPLQKGYVWSIRAAAEIVKMRDGQGLRRRGGFEFGKAPVLLRGDLPAAIAADPYLRIRQVEETEGMQVVDIPVVPAVDEEKAGARA